MCFKEQMLMNATLRLEEGCTVRILRECCEGPHISGEPCGSQGHPVPIHPLPQDCLCQSLSWPEGRQTDASCLAPPCPSHLHPLSWFFFLNPPLQDTSSLKVISSLAGKLHISSSSQVPSMHCEEFPCGRKMPVCPPCFLFPSMEAEDSLSATVIPPLRPLLLSSSLCGLASPSSLHLALQRALLSISCLY